MKYDSDRPVQHSNERVNKLVHPSDCPWLQHDQHTDVIPMNDTDVPLA